jgi:uncharacterized protein (TIGR03437 family)
MPQSPSFCVPTGVPPVSSLTGTLLRPLARICLSADRPRSLVALRRPAVTSGCLPRLAILRAAAVALLFTTVLAAQSAGPFYMTSLPTGLQPLGIDRVATGGSISAGNYSDIAIVANSGENSVSVFGVLTQCCIGHVGAILSDQKITGIPSPYAVAGCPVPAGGGAQALATSPADNSAWIVFGLSNLPERVQVGPQPRAIACYLSAANARIGVVSNVGDNSLTVFNADTLTATTTISGVPGSSALHGILVNTDPVSKEPIAYVASTSGNVITVVNLSTFNVVTQLSVPSPTSISMVSGNLAVASSGGNQILYYNGQLQPILTPQNVSNPQDFINTTFGLFAVSVGQSSIAFWAPSALGSAPTLLPGAPGGASVTALNFSYLVNGSGPYIGDVSTVTSQAIFITSTSTNSVIVFEAPQFQPPAPAIPANFQVANGASYGTSETAPGSLASVIIGTGVNQPFNAPTPPLPTTLGGATLSIGGTLSLNTTTNSWVYSSTGASQAPLLFVGPTQVNFQMPPGISPGIAVPAQLTKADGSTLLTTFNVGSTAPGIFTLLQNGQGQGAVLNADYSQNGSLQSTIGAKPAARGSYVQIFATGGGATTPALQPGAAAPASGNPLIYTNVQPTVTIGGVSAQVLFSGMAPGFVGLWQINAVVPAGATPGSVVPLVVSAGGATSNSVTIAVQ